MQFVKLDGDDQPAIPDSYADLVALLVDSNSGTLRDQPRGGQAASPALRPAPRYPRRTPRA